MFRHSLLSGALIAVALLSSPTAAPLRVPTRAIPSLMLWAWERPEDFRGNDADIGVAFLAQTITLAASPSTDAASPSAILITKRRQPLRVSRTTALVAVTRIEVNHARSREAPRVDADALASAIAATSTLPQVVAVQIDFDAAVSERTLYADVLMRLRRRLASSIPISITALASWCVGDDWLGGLPIDEAVPMLFRMGPENEPYRQLAFSRTRAATACQNAVGWSVDEPIGIRPKGRRIYVFNPKPWTPAAIAGVEREVQ